MKSLYVNGIVGNLGTKYLIENKYLELEKHFNKEFLDKVLNELNGGAIPPLFIGKEKIGNEDFISSVVDRIDIGKGGLLSALWKICERNEIGIEYILKNVPISQGIIEISNYFDINPYRLLTEDAEIIIFDDKENIYYNGFIVTNDEVNIKNQNYEYLGRIANNKKRIRIDNDIESFLTKDYKDDIEKVLPNYIKKYAKCSNS